MMLPRWLIISLSLLLSLSIISSKTKLFVVVAAAAKNNIRSNINNAVVLEEDSSSYRYPQTTLGDSNNNDKKKKEIVLPLCGMGVGNLQHDLIREEISTALSDDEEMNYRLIDTAHASRNENLIADGIRQASLADDGENSEIHIVTKIWYTYLGYERTLISVKESLMALNNLPRTANIHMLLHWPRCNDDIPWMNCLEEEDALPQHVKDAGPPPHLNEQTAFKESWRALEDIYLGKFNFGSNNSSKITSIGVSNFNIDDLKDLLTDARITPHILQGNVWSYAFDPFLIDYCHENNIHFQAYNVMNGIHGRQNDSPLAFASLSAIAEELMSSSSSDTTTVTPAQIIIKWLIQNNVSTIPRTTNIHHLKENSPSAIASVPKLNTKQQEKVQMAVRALLSGNDLKPAEVTFVNKKGDDIHLYWKNHDGESIPVKNNMSPGEHFSTSTHPGHVFVAVHNSNNKDEPREQYYTVGAYYGERQQIHIIDDEL